MNEYLYVLKPTRLGMLTDEGPTEDEQRIVGEHFAHLQNLHSQGTVILAGRTLNADETTMGLVIFRSESDEEAERIMLSDPAIINKVMTATLFPYRIALGPGFE